MTEWERLQKELPYNDFDPDLFQRRVAAKSCSGPITERRMKKWSCAGRSWGSC